MGGPSDESRLSAYGRIAAAGALLLAIVLAALVLFTGDDGYRVTARFEAATQAVEGNLVQVAGRKVGTVEGIELGADGMAEVELKIDDESITPLREGTQANLRLRSLTGVVNRYVDLRIPPAGGRPIPEGGTIDVEDTSSAVDLDELFNLFDDRTKKGLRDFIRGNARLYDGRGELANAGWRYVNPSLVAAQRLFDELGGDSRTLERFVVDSSRLVTDVADRRDDLAALIDRLATTTGAIAREEGSLRSAISQLPPFMRRANSTFVDLRTTLDDLDPLVAESKPVTPKLRKVLAELRPFALDARPTVRDLAALVRHRGKDDDLLELARAIPAFRDIAIGPVRRNGRQRPGSFATSTRSLREQAPHLAFFRPYLVDFTGWVDDFSHSGIYDANGSASRVATSVNAFASVGSQLKPVPEELRQRLGDMVVRRGQTNRCPGGSERPAEDGSNPWWPTPGFNCDPTQVPPGP